jgi:hypothetical protein
MAISSRVLDITGDSGHLLKPVFFFAGDSGHLLKPLPSGTPGWIKTLSKWQAKQAALKKAAARSQGL